jgi:sodium/proline symporter
MIYTLVFIIYCGILLWLSFQAKKHNHNTSAYIIGGRKLGSLTTSISAGASDMSGWLFLGLPGAIYAFGFNQIWIVFGLIIGAYFNWLLVSKKLRTLSEDTNTITIPSFISSNLLKSSTILKVIAATTIILFFTIYVSAGIVSGGVLLSTLFDISYFNAIIIATILIISYVMIGGYLAVAWTDLMQGLLMVMIIIIVPIFAISYMDWNFNGIKQQIVEVNAEYFNIFHNLSFIGIVSLMAWGLGYFGQPHILNRFMGINDAEKLASARRINIIWMSLSMGFSIFVGFIATAYFVQNPLTNPEQAMISLTKSTSPTILLALTFMAILAAIVSTASSQLLVISSAIAEDLPFVKKRATIFIARASILFIGLIAMLLAFNNNSSILSLVGYAWAGFGASFGPLIILITRGYKITNIAGIVGILSGALTVLIWKNLHGGIFDLYEILPGFAISFISILIANKITKKD